MSAGTIISPTDLRDYAKGQGWTLVNEALADRLYVLTNPTFSRRQLVFPMDTTAPDYTEAVERVLEKLAEMEERSPGEVLRSLLEVGDDALAYRVLTQRDDELSLPLAFAGSLLTGAQQMLLAAASTVLRPQAHHPRLSRSEAQQLLEIARFGHTAPGSFVLNVSCPVKALDVQVPGWLDPFEDHPFVRQTTLTLCRALGELITAIEGDTLDTLVEETKHDPFPYLSSNLCEALTRLEDGMLKNSVEISFRWAGSIPLPDGEGRVSRVRIQHDYFSRIEEVRRELRSSEQHLEDVFPATVERLAGEMGADGRRAGEVVLSLLTPDGEQVRARAVLDADQYALADQAHMAEGAYVRVRGRLRPGRQPRLLTDIQSFDLWLR